MGVSQVATKRSIPLRCTPAGGVSGGVGSTSIYSLGGTEAPATGRRPRTRPARLLPRPLSGVCTLSASAARRRQVPQICAFGDELDRKSTRLNSSHLVISYAVFCLKKK